MKKAFKTAITNKINVCTSLCQQAFKMEKYRLSSKKNRCAIFGVQQQSAYFRKLFYIAVAYKNKINVQFTLLTGFQNGKVYIYIKKRCAIFGHSRPIGLL